MQVNTREIALDIVLEVLEKGAYTHYVMGEVLDKYAYLEKRDRAFLTRLAEGTIERCVELDYVIGQFSKTPVKKMKPLIRGILRLGVYQLLYMDSVPDAAVCNESVKLATKRGFSGLKGFVNGVLRNISRQKESIVYPDKKKDLTAYLSVTYSMPAWIVKKWQASYDKDTLESILASFLEPRPLIIRIREDLPGEGCEAIKKEMEEQGIVLAPLAALPYAFTVADFDRVEDLPGYAQGEIAIQDAGSMQIIEVADIPGMLADATQPAAILATDPSSDDVPDASLSDTAPLLILDVCAAPGGKSLHAAEKLRGKGRVIARDVSDDKVALMQENIDRIGYTNITAEVHDATVFDPDLEGKCDLVIADLPCSGLGVIGRKADIKYRISPEDITAIAALQRQILTTIHRYIKPGGKLLFSTCTLTREENEANRDFILDELPFTLLEEATLLPGAQDTDGFYMAVFTRE